MNTQSLIGVLIIILALLVMVLVGAPASTNNIGAVTAELSQGTPGVTTAGFILDKVIGVAIGIVVTGVLGGLAAFAFSAARDAWEERKKGDWEPGPNAGYRRKNAPKPATLGRDELFQIALLNAMTNGNAGQYMPQITTTQSEEPPPAEF